MNNQEIEKIRTGEPIPRDVAAHIKAFVTESDYFKVAGLHQDLITGLTLKNLFFYKNTVTKRNLEPVKTLCRLAIQHSQSYKYSREVIVAFLGEDESEALQKLNEQAA